MHREGHREEGQRRQQGREDPTLKVSTQGIFPNLNVENSYSNSNLFCVVCQGEEGQLRGEEEHGDSHVRKGRQRQEGGGEDQGGGGGISAAAAGGTAAREGRGRGEGMMMVSLKSFFSMFTQWSNRENRERVNRNM